METASLRTSAKRAHPLTKGKAMKNPDQKPPRVHCTIRPSTDNPARVYFLPENMIKAIRELDRADYVTVGAQNAPVQIATLRDVLKTWDKSTKKNPHPRAALEITPDGIRLWEYPDGQPRTFQILYYRKPENDAHLCRLDLSESTTEAPAPVADKWLSLATAKGEEAQRRPALAKVYGNISADGRRLHRDLTLPASADPVPFPWQQAYPPVTDNLVTIPSPALKQAVKQAAKMNRDCVTIYFNGSADVSATSEEFGAVRTSITENYQHIGADLTIALNPRFILDALSGMADDVTIQLASESAPIIITDGKREALLMPLLQS